MAASEKRNFTDRFPAMNPKGRRSRRDPLRSDSFLQTCQSAKFGFFELACHEAAVDDLTQSAESSHSASRKPYPLGVRITSHCYRSSNTTVATTTFPVIHSGTKFRARSQRGSYFTTNVKCTTATLMGMALGYVHRRNCYGKQSKDTAHQKCTCSYRG